MIQVQKSPFFVRNTFGVIQLNEFVTYKKKDCTLQSVAYVETECHYSLRKNHLQKQVPLITIQISINYCWSSVVMNNKSLEVKWNWLNGWSTPILHSYCINAFNTDDVNLWQRIPHTEFFHCFRKWKTVRITDESKHCEKKRYFVYRKWVLFQPYSEQKFPLLTFREEYTRTR